MNRAIDRVEVPGPEIRVNEGDTVRVTLVNRLSVGTTIHWHGIDNTPAMDGPAGLNQAAVEPGQDFVYEFVADPAGSRMYHSHTDVHNQVALGLYGPLIVEPREADEERVYDREYTIMLNEWDLELTPDVVTGKAPKVDLPLITQGVRWTVECALSACAAKGRANYWALATRGELRLVVDGDEACLEDFEAAAAQAVGDGDLAALTSTAQQLALLHDLGFRTGLVERARQIIDETKQQLSRLLGAPRETPRHVVLFSGHMIDKPDRPQPRLPENKAEAAARASIDMRPANHGPWAQLAIIDTIRDGELASEGLGALESARVSAPYDPQLALAFKNRGAAKDLAQHHRPPRGG